MRPQRAISPILATIVLVVIGVFVTGIVWMWNSMGSATEPDVYKLEFSSASLKEPINMGNAGWQIEIIVKNTGNVEAVVNRVYINGRLVDEMGLNPGDSLSSSTEMGTDIPPRGVAIPVGQSVQMHVWIGADLFSKNTQVIIELQKPNQYELMRYLVLS